MDKNIQRNGIINVLALLGVGVAGFAVARQAGSQAGQVAAAFIGFGVLVAFISWFQMRLEERERLEKLELDEMARSKASATLFEARESELLPAQRSREQFQRYFVPIFTTVLFIGQVVVAFFLWRWLVKAPVVITPGKSMVALALFGMLWLTLFILGRFSVTIARLEDNRLLRPSAGYMLLGSYLCAAVAVGIGLIMGEFPLADHYVARGMCILLGIVAIETLLNLILEIYRPRVKGKVGRPLYESRLVGLLGQPEGLITTAAQALDYQFGFKVSDTWFYRFLEERLGLLVLLQLGVLVFSTCFVVIETGEQALLERFGQRGQVLGAGPHLKLPWPIDKVYRYRTERIQTLDIGFSEDEEHEHQPAIQWTVAHTKEDNFLVASRETAAPEEGATTPTRKTPPVSLLTVSIPVQFQVTNIYDWVYKHEDGSNLLYQISTREVTRYLSSADFDDIMSRSRYAAGNTLRERIQTAANNYQVGVNILYVGLQDIHPPVKVAAEFEKVVAAIQQKQAKILNAEADAIKTNALAGALAFTTTNTAAAESQRLKVVAEARAAAFVNQLPAFNAAPSVYKARTYYKTFPRAIAGARKYIVLTTNADNVVTFDLQDKISSEFIGNFRAPEPKK